MLTRFCVGLGGRWKLRWSVNIHGHYNYIQQWTLIAVQLPKFNQGRLQPMLDLYTSDYLLFDFLGLVQDQVDFSV